MISRESNAIGNPVEGHEISLCVACLRGASVSNITMYWLSELELDTTMMSNDSFFIFCSAILSVHVIIVSAPIQI